MEIARYSGDCRNYSGGNGAPGSLIIYDDRIVFEPSSTWAKAVTLGKGLESFTMHMRDIVQCKKKFLWFFDIYDNKGRVMSLNMMKKNEIIDIIEEVRANMEKSHISKNAN